MRLVSYDGVTFASSSLTCWIERGLPGENRTADLMPRRDGSPLVIGATDSGRPIPCVFTSRDSDERVTEHRLRKLLADINVRSTEARTLVCEIDVDTDNDGDIDAQVNVQVSAIVGPWKWRSGGMKAIELTFYAVDAIWEETADTTDGPDTISAADPDTVIVNSGSVPVYPVIERSAPTSSFLTSGTQRQRITVTNAGELPIEREAFSPLIAYTATNWAYNKLLKDGVYHPMTAMADFGYSGSYVLFWSEVSVDAGDSETYDLIIAFNEAVGPTGLSTFSRLDGNYCALHLGSDFVLNATSGGASTITDTGEAWTTDVWAGACVYIFGGTGAGQARLISSNTATQLTVARAWTTTPDTTSDFQIIGSGWYLDGGRASSATSTTLTDSSQSWDADTLIGGTISIISGTGSGQSKTITDNTATVITVDSAFSVTPDATSVYRVERFGYHRYYVAQVNHAERHRGGWQQSARYTKPGRIQWGADVLNGWERFTLLENNDDFNQSRSVAINVGPTHYFPILDADRRRGQDRLLEEEGQGDGVAIYNPLGYSGIRFDYQIKNPNSESGATTGICKFVLAGREAGGDEFTQIVTDNQLQTTLTNVAAQYVNLTAYGSPEQLYMGVQPADDVEVSRAAADTDTATVRWYSTLRLWLDIYGKLSWSVGSVESVIPVQDEIRIGDYALQIGMRDGQRLYMKDSGQTLHFDCANARAWIEDGGVETEDVTYAVTPVVYDADGDYTVADRWPFLAAGNNTVTCDGEPWATDGAFTLTFTFKEKVYT